MLFCTTSYCTLFFQPHFTVYVQIQIESFDKSGYKKIRHVNACTLVTSNQQQQHYAVTAEVTDKIPHFHTSSTNMGMI
jgi:hypothetical protein